MVSALDSGSTGPGLSPGWVILLCSWARHFTLTLPLSTQELMGTSKLSGKPDEMLGGYHDGLASHPGGVAILLVASC